MINITRNQMEIEHKGKIDIYTFTEKEFQGKKLKVVCPENYPDENLNHGIYNMVMKYGLVYMTKNNEYFHNWNKIEGDC